MSRCHIYTFTCNNMRNNKHEKIENQSARDRIVDTQIHSHLPTIITFRLLFVYLFLYVCVWMCALPAFSHVFIRWILHGIFISSQFPSFFSILVKYQAHTVPRATTDKRKMMIFLLQIKVQARNVNVIRGESTLTQHDSTQLGLT